MYGVLGEHRSDALTLRVLIRRLAGDQRLPVKAEGFTGRPGLLKDGAKRLSLLRDLRYKRFVVATDADRDNAEALRAEVIARVIRPSGITEEHCVIIPVQEIEAWILADLPAVSHVLTSWHPDPITQNPEAINNPKEHLQRLSRNSNRRARYDHGTHNEKVAAHLNLTTVAQLCPSFRPLVRFVTGTE